MAFKHLIRILSILYIISLSAGCGGSSSGDNGGSEEITTGEAILDIQIIDGGLDGTLPVPPEGFTLLDIDLNDGTGGNYLWLCYKEGKADGSEGMPVSTIYTVDEFDGETSHGGTQLPVNLNKNDLVQGGHEPLWLYYIKKGSPVARCIVVYNATTGVKKYAPPEAEGKYDIVWVQEQIPDILQAPSSYGVPPNTQDLNEGQDYGMSDYIYIGYGID